MGSIKTNILLQEQLVPRFAVQINSYQIIISMILYKLTKS